MTPSRLGWTVAWPAAVLCGVVSSFGFDPVGLPFAMILGVTVFGEHPDTATLTGAAIIVACGVIILGQNRRIS